MSSILNYDNTLFRGLEKVVNVFYISVLWIIFSIPLFTVGASTTAMYYCVNKVLRRGRSYVFKEFWGAFKRNFKQSTIICLILWVVTLLMAIDAYIMKQFYDAGSGVGKLYVVFVILFIFEVAWASYIFPYIARFENTKKVILKNSALMAVAHLPQTILMIVMIVVVIGFYFMLPAIIFFVPAAFMWVWNIILERIFRKYMSEEDLKAEEEKKRDLYH